MVLDYGVSTHENLKKRIKNIDEKKYQDKKIQIMKADNREKIKEISAKKRQYFLTELGGTKEEKDKCDM